jgi:hypothetical protein
MEFGYFTGGEDGHLPQLGDPQSRFSHEASEQFELAGWCVKNGFWIFTGGESTHQASAAQDLGRDNFTT